ncbi:MAG: hypothetical protein AB1546_08535 [bacterium]
MKTDQQIAQILRFFVVLSSALVICYVAIALTPDLLANTLFSVVLWVLVSGLYFSAVLIAVRSAPSRNFTLVVVGFALILRITVWHISPEFTTDYYRYVWDGKVAATGINPFRYAPADEALKHLRTPNIYEKINFKDARTIYGPLAQAGFRLLYGVFGENITCWRATFFIADVMNLFLIIALLGALGLPRHWMVVYGFHPLVLIDLCANMHLDVFLIAILLAAFVCASVNRAMLGLVFLAGATLVKYFPAILLPLFLRRITAETSNLYRWLRVSSYLTLFTVIIIAAYLPYASPDVDLAAGLRYFSTQLGVTAWSPYFLIMKTSGKVGADAVAVAVLAIIILVGLSKKDLMRWLRWMLLVLSAMALLTPVQRPWYFAWALPLCCVQVWWSWLLLGCLSLLTYSVLISYEYIYQIKFIVYIIFYAALIVEFYIKRKGKIK